MVVLMAVTAVPMSGFVGLELPKWSEVFATRASAVGEYKEGYYTYTVENGEATIINCLMSIKGDVSIPDKFGGYLVTSIGSDAFYGCADLTSVIIPNGVTSIGDSAFCNCTGLTSVTIPNSVTTIGSNSFYNCTGLFSLTIPKNVISIGKKAFYNCTGLTKIYWNAESVGPLGENDGPDIYEALTYDVFTNVGINSKGVDVVFGDEVKSIPDYVFCGEDWYTYKSNIKSVSIGKGVKRIGDFSFFCCYNLKGIKIPNSVTSIGNGAFCGCENLTSVSIPKSVKTIGKRAFSVSSTHFEKSSLTNVSIENGVESVGDYAFCSTLIKNIIIPDSVKTLGYGAFASCSYLESATIGNGIETIPECAFVDCARLTSLKIGKNIKTIKENAFAGLKIVPDVDFAGTESDWEKVVIDKTNYMLLRATIYYNANISHTHSYISKITKKATCIESGVKTFSCDCGKTYTETISATGHKTSSWITDKAATCTVGGTQHKECTVCKTVLSTGTISAKGHSFVSEITAATCTSIGFETKTCSACGECHFVRVIPATGHSLVTAVTPATQTESGISVTSCKTCGTITKATLIKRIASVSLSKTAFTCNGKVQTPTVTVKDSSGKVLKNGTDYKVKYSSGRKNPGQYSVTVSFKGNYSGKKPLTFTIVPAAPTLSVTAGAKKATLKWNKQTGATGYIVYMATSKSGKFSKIATLKGNSKISYTKTGLTKGKTYYFKVCAYTTAGGKNINGTFSAVKSVKVK